MSINVIYDIKQSIVETTDDQVLQALSYDLPTNCSTKATVSIISRDQSSGDTFSVEHKFVAKRIIGTASIVGMVIDSMPAQSDLSMVTVSDVIGTNGISLTVSVTGLLKTTIDWLIKMEIAIEQDNS